MIKHIRIAYFDQAFYFVLILCLLSSCISSKKLNYDYYYFRDGNNVVEEQQKQILIQPNDLLSIVVYSRSSNQEQAAIFNIPASANNLLQGYQVSTTGIIDIPIIGAVNVVGLSKKQLQDTMIVKLTNYVKNPSVIVKFLQFNVNVLGEVHAPGTHKFNVDKVTIIDALSAAGDLTDYGRRDSILVIREEDGKKITYSIDLRNKSLFNSAVYNLQPNDIVYVSPNKFKIKNLNVDPDVQRRTGFLVTFLTVAISLTTLIITVFRK